MAETDFLIYSPSGVLVADLSGSARSRKFTVGRNKPGSASFDIDGDQLAEVAESLNTTPNAILAPGINELRIKRTAGARVWYPFGGRIDKVETKGSGAEITHTVTVNGFLSMFKDAFVEVQRVFTAEDAGQILWTVIDEFQTGSSNIFTTPLPTETDYGITEGTIETIADKDRTYEPGKSIYDVLVQMTELQTTTTDIEFEADKTFNVYARQGSDKPSIVLEYKKNIIDFSIPTDGGNISNRVITYGAGSGADRTQTIVEDEASQINYHTRQHIQQFQSVEETDTLDDHGYGYLQATKDPNIVPDINVLLTGDVTLEDIWIGDRPKVKIDDPALLNPINGLYRIEQMAVDLDDNAGERAKVELA